MGNDINVDGLEKRLADLKGTLGFAHRAFVIELAGTPKSGKSTSVEAIRHFFSRNGLRVHVLAERAAMCPIPMKGHLFFNTWCACSMLAELLANVEADADIIIVDRGIFDSLVWLTMQLQRGEITEQEANVIDSFLLLDRWRTLIDLVAVMKVPSVEAMRRENSQRITVRTGSIMNEQTLNVLSESVSSAYDKYGSKFAQSFLHETSGQDVRESNIELAGKILDRLEPFLDPKILVVPQKVLDTLPLTNKGCFAPEASEAALRCISEHGKYVQRSKAESDDDLVQIIPSGILVYADKVFVFRRKETDSKYRLYGKTTILEATHTIDSGQGTKQLLEDALFARIARSLFMGRRFPMKLVGYCWDRDEANSRRHFAVVFEVQIDNERTADDLKRKEFRKWRGPNLAGDFYTWPELAKQSMELDLEPWSQAILRGKGLLD
jgi:predicted NUDIX family phosphoesterase/thymidylate kinase